MKQVFVMAFLFTLAALSCTHILPDNMERLELRKEFYELKESCVTQYKLGNSDKMLTTARELLTTSQFISNDSFLVFSYRIMGNCYYLKNDHLTAINYYFKGIQLCESNPDLKDMLPDLYNNIGFNYGKLGLYDKSREYLKKAELVINPLTKDRALSYIYENLASSCLGQDSPIVALNYLKLASAASLRTKENYIQASIYLDYAIASGKLFEENSNMEDLNKAIADYNKAISFSDLTGDLKHLSNSMYQFGVFLYKLKQLDSAGFYAKRSLDTAMKYKYRDNIIGNADLLQKIYEQKGKEHRAYYYACLRNDNSDSLRKMNNASELMALTFNEGIHEREMAVAAKEADERRIRAITYLFIAGALITLMVIILLVTRKICVTEKFITLTGSGALLITFEFINLVLHPQLEELTHHSEILMFLSLIFIAAVLIPVHHRLEKIVKKHLTANNDRLRNN